MDLMSGKKGYINIVKEITDKIKTTSCRTIQGSDFLNNLYKNLNESITPMLTLKQFSSGAEDLMKTDTSIKDVLEFANQSIDNSTDLNFIINLCKEEHFANMLKTGHPSPQDTIKAFEKEFKQPANVIEAGIKSGIFDTMESDLLRRVKEQLTKDTLKIKKLNEDTTLDYSADSVKYAPVGITLMKDKKMYALLESFVFEIDKETKTLTPSTVELKESERLLMDSIDNLPYNLEGKYFELNENWDFTLRLNTNGLVSIGKTPENTGTIPREKVKDLLLESMEMYESDNLKYPFYNRTNFAKDADRFLMLLENTNRLVKFDTVTVIKNLNESDKFVLFDNNNINNNKPAIVVGNGVKRGEMLFESFSEMTQHIEGYLETKAVTQLFENQLSFENNKLMERQQKITQLNEEQRELNQKIKETENLKRLAEDGSPAMVQLNESASILQNRLTENLNETDLLVNKFKLY